MQRAALIRYKFLDNNAVIRVLVGLKGAQVLENFIARVRRQRCEARFLSHVLANYDNFDIIISKMSQVQRNIHIFDNPLGVTVDFCHMSLLILNISHYGPFPTIMQIIIFCSTSLLKRSFLILR